ncbi:hypothetical protein [Winogradskya humida]|uniref:ADP-ribosyltransferase exoenzyme n=1 Tax=Winogradskya humida TaxID=113566 RepID=A0ABQ3ZMJ3_9ACTN|nr:hypothetical protein [Actinoplanes humidus]GIE19795.1 hypothetical protein Ahu01nite_028970 [Actinoplanes humidus]
MATGIRGLLRGGKDEPSGVVQHTVGNALVLHAEDSISAEAQSLALSVVEDAENDVVVLDLGDGMPIGSWESMAGVLPRRRRGIRLVACGRHHNAAAMAGQWLSERLNRTVIAPDGELVRGSAGALFVHSTPGSGWVRFRPGKPPTWDAKRYPTPLWDKAATDKRASSSTGEIEPLPGGVWIHDIREPEIVDEHRKRLIADVPCQPEVMTVLLGCPGTAPLSLDDVVRFWRDLDPDSRLRTRFVQYGDVRLPEGEAFGQALADLLGTQVVCYTGVPVGAPGKFEIRTVRADGVLGWPPFAIELGYTPRAHPNSKARRAAVLSHRAPLRWTEEISPRVFWYAPDAVVEVVQTGLWVRAVEEPPNAERVRATPLDPEGSTLIFDDTVDERSMRMRELAEDLAARVEPTVGQDTALFPASVMVPGQRPAGRAEATLRPSDIPRQPIQARIEMPLPPRPAATIMQSPEVAAVVIEPAAAAAIEQQQVAPTAFQQQVAPAFQQQVAPTAFQQQQVAPTFQQQSEQVRPGPGQRDFGQGRSGAGQQDFEQGRPGAGQQDFEQGRPGAVQRHFEQVEPTVSQPRYEAVPATVVQQRIVPIMPEGFPETRAFAAFVQQQSQPATPPVQQPAEPPQSEPVQPAAASFLEPSAFAQPARDQSVVEPSAFAQPATEQSAIESPTFVQPAVDQSVVEPPTLPQPAIQPESFRAPVFEAPPAFAPPAFDQQGGGQSVVEAPAFGQRVVEAPASGQPAVEAPAFGRPVVEAPALEQQAGGQQTGGQPTVEPSTFEQAVGGQPAVGAPAFEQRVAEQPSVETPAFEAPAIEAPAFERPAMSVVEAVGEPAAPVAVQQVVEAVAAPAIEPSLRAYAEQVVDPVTAPMPMSLPVTEPVHNVDRLQALDPAAATRPKAQPDPKAQPEPKAELNPEPKKEAVPDVRFQPVPSPGASALMPSRALDDERAWLRRTLSRDFDIMASSVSRIMSEHPGLQATGGAAGKEDVLADSVAVRLYLSGRGAGIDAGLRSATNGPHVPFARCTVSGLSRLPSFRGTTVYRTSPTSGEWAQYRERRVVTDWAFVNMLTAPCSSQDGDTDVLVWSMTARRTAVLEPEGDDRIEDRVLFLPGTHYKILELHQPEAGGRGSILMREIGANEIGDDGRVDPNRVSLDELAVTSLRRSVERWASAEPKRRIGAGSTGRFGVLPGLDRRPVREEVSGR